MTNMFDRVMSAFPTSNKTATDLASAVQTETTVNELENLQNEIDQLKQKLEKYEAALEQEVWDSKKGKFVPVRELPWVAKVLE